MTQTQRFSRTWLINQLKVHSVVLVSLVTALCGLGYNTWRDHQSELNNNMRVAAFEVLKSLGELQTVVNYAYYDKDQWRGNPLDGWKNVLMVRPEPFVMRDCVDSSISFASPGFIVV